MRHVRVEHGLLVLDADELAEQSVVDGPLERAEIRGVAQDVPHRDENARLPLAPEEAAAFLRGPRHRLLEQQIVA